MEGICNLIALGILLAWPVIPLFWLPLRFFPRRVARLGRAFLLVTAALWLAVAAITWHWHGSLLEYRIGIPWTLRVLGGLLFVSGLLLQAWTALVLGRRITGLPELENAPVRLETRPPFNLCRHPTYLAHLMIFAGGALLTGYLSIFILAAADFLITRFLIVPLEERDMEMRFGAGYHRYKRHTPCFFPVFHKRKRQ